MSATATPALTGILGIDLGKFKSVACLLADDGELVFETFATDRGVLKTLLERDRPRVVAAGGMLTLRGHDRGRGRSTCPRRPWTC